MNQAVNDQDKSAEKLEQKLSDIKRVILVLSGKGGVGKSTMASNIAVELARDGSQVGLLDIDIHGPSIPSLLGLEGQQVLSNGDDMLPIEYTPNLKVMSIGFLIREQNDAVIWRGPMKYGVIRQFLSDVEWGYLDYLVVDSPPGTGDEPLSVGQMLGKKAEAVIVTTPQKISTNDVRKSISFCRKLNIPITGLIENMSGAICPHCGEVFDLFTTGGGKQLSEDMDVPFLGAIPFDPAVVSAGDTGRPVSLDNAESAYTGVLQDVVDKIKDS